MLNRNKYGIILFFYLFQTISWFWLASLDGMCSTSKLDKPVDSDFNFKLHQLVTRQDKTLFIILMWAQTMLFQSFLSFFLFKTSVSCEPSVQVDGLQMHQLHPSLWAWTCNEQNYHYQSVRAFLNGFFGFLCFRIRIIIMNTCMSWQWKIKWICLQINYWNQNRI